MCRAGVLPFTARANNRKMGGMNHRLALLVPFFALCLFFGLRGAGAQGEAFFDALYDVPVMPGMEEVPGASVVFDAPSGRIAQVHARLLPGKTAQDMMRFYDLTLSQMGWRKTAPLTYEREEERLTLSTDPEEGANAVVFRLEPL